MISISAVPGGNPAALADPEGFATEWSHCDACRAFTCDRCLARQQGQCRCGAPGRLYTEPERSAVADAMRTGKAVPVGGGSQLVAALKGPLPGAPQTQLATAQLPDSLQSVAKLLEADLAAGNRERAASHGRLAASMMATQGMEAPLEQLGWLSSFGESYYRWQLYAEGVEYWKGVYQLARKHGQADGDLGQRAVAIAGCFQVLSGQLQAGLPASQGVLALAQRLFGAEHVLVKDVASRLGAQANAAPGFGAPPPQWGPGGAQGGPVPPPAVDMAPRPPPNAVAIPPGIDPPTKLALWVTLAWLEIAAADGHVSDSEYALWKSTIARLRLPDVWDRAGGAQGLQRMLHQGALQQLCVEFATQAEDFRARMTALLVEFVMADGSADPRELAVMHRIAAWLGTRVQTN